MKKVLLSAVVVAASLSLSSCISKIISTVTDDQCWLVESTIVIGSDTKTVSRYYWGTALSVAAQARTDLKNQYGEEASIKNVAKDASKYKTQEDCEAAN